MEVIKYILLFLFFCNTLKAQQIVKSSGAGEVEFPISLSEDRTKKLAKEQASIAALEAAFGTIVVDGSSTYISNSQNNKLLESKSVYNFISNHAVNGEVLEVVSEKYQTTIKPIISGKDTLKVRFMICTIEIKAKELVAPPIQFDAYPLVCDSKKCKTTEFNDGDDFYFYFNSPVSGYLWIYLDDGTNAQCLLPYRDMPTEQEGGFWVKADAEYIFFSNSTKNHNIEKLNFTIDTYQLGAEKQEDLNRCFIIFSEKPLAKPRLDNTNQSILSKDEQIANYAAPKSLPSEEFQKWLMQNRSYKKTQIALKNFDITIRKRNN